MDEPTEDLVNPSPPPDPVGEYQVFKAEEVSMIKRTQSSVNLESMDDGAVSESGSLEEELIALKILDSFSERLPNHDDVDNSIESLSLDSQSNPMSISVPELRRESTKQELDYDAFPSFRDFTEKGDLEETCGLMQDILDPTGSDNKAARTYETLPATPSKTTPDRLLRFEDFNDSGPRVGCLEGKASKGNGPNEPRTPRRPGLSSHDAAITQTDAFPSDESDMADPLTCPKVVLERLAGSPGTNSGTYEEFREGKEHTLGDFEDTVASSEGGNLPLKHILSPSPTGEWGAGMGTLDPTGFLFVMDRVMDCFDGPGDLKHPLELSPDIFDDRTIDSLYDSLCDELDWEKGIEYEASEWLLSCCNSAIDGLELTEHLLDEESTLDEESRNCLFSKESSLGSDSSGTLSLPENFSSSLEIGAEPVKVSVLDQTAMTDADSTLNPEDEHNEF